MGDDNIGYFKLRTKQSVFSRPYFMARKIKNKMYGEFFWLRPSLFVFINIQEITLI